MAALGWVLAVFAPAAAYLFSVPAAAASVGGAFGWRHGAVAGLAASVVLWFPVLYGIEVALGLGLAPALAAAGVLSLSFALPLFADLPRRAIGGGLAVAGLCAASTAVLPPYSEASPERVWDQRVVASEPPPRLEALALRVRETEWTVTGRLRSTRGASDLILSIGDKAGVRELRIEGAPVRDPGQPLAIYGVPDEGVGFEVVLRDPSVAWQISDRTYVANPPKEPLQTVSWNGFESWVVADVSPVQMAERTP
jgi:hypothetical protein